MLLIRPTTNIRNVSSIATVIITSSVWVRYCAVVCRAMSVVSSHPTTTTTAADSGMLANTKSRANPIIAVGQLRSTSSKFDNLINIAKCAGWAKQKNACMLFLPECFGYMGESAQLTLQNAEPPLAIEDDTTTAATSTANRKNDETINEILESVVDFCSTDTDGNYNVSLLASLDTSQFPSETISLLEGIRIIARRSRLWISGGGMHVSGAPINDDGQARIYNTHIIVNDDGIVQCYYRKIHLFDVSIPGKVTLKESNTTAPGNEIKLCDSPIGRLGVTVCYDLRFPETYIELLKQGAQIMLVPSAFTVPTGTAHWHTLLRARAIENQCYVIAAAQYGRHNEKRESYGHSIVIDPWGVVLADAGGYDGPGTTPSLSLENNINPPEPPSIITCPIDLDHLDSIRQRIPIQQHRVSAEF